MKIIFAWAGKTRNAAMRSLIEEYAKRIGRYHPFEIAEVRSSSGLGSPVATRRKEGENLLATLPEKGYVIALSPDGTSVTTKALAEIVRDVRGRGLPALAFVVGGEEGLHESVERRADMRMALTPMTLPHELARVLLAEQIYRVFALLAGHPYPR